MFGTRGRCSRRQTKNVNKDLVGVMPAVTFDGVFTSDTANRYSHFLLYIYLLLFFSFFFFWGGGGALFVCLFVLLINNSYILRVSFDLV